MAYMIDIVVSQKLHRYIFLPKTYDKKNQGNKKIDAGQKNDAHWNDKLIILFKAPNC